MSFILKGFPQEISEYIELPNIAELLTYPSFFNVDAEEFYKHGTDFQRKLLDLTPLRNNKKYISVLCEVRFLYDKLRCCTGSRDNDAFSEWHIDDEAHMTGVYDYGFEKDIVHLLTSEATSMTEFLKHDVEIDWDPSRPYNEFNDFLSNNRDNYDFTPVKMPHNRIVTFTNHLHRATNSTKPEFKFMFRVAETDAPDKKMGKYDPNHVTGVVDIESDTFVPNIARKNNSVTIYLPKSLRENPKYKHYLPDDDSINLINSFGCSRSNEVEVPEDYSEILKMNIEKALWGKDASKILGDVSFASKNSVILLNYDIANDNNELSVNAFYENMDKTIQISSSGGQNFYTPIRSFNRIIDSQGQKVIAFVANLTDFQVMMLGEESINVSFNEESKYSLKHKDENVLSLV